MLCFLNFQTCSDTLIIISEYRKFYFFQKEDSSDSRTTLRYCQKITYEHVEPPLLGKSQQESYKHQYSSLDRETQTESISLPIQNAGGDDPTISVSNTACVSQIAGKEVCP